MFSFTQIRVIDQHAGIAHNGPIMVCEKVGFKVNAMQLCDYAMQMISV